MFERGRFAAVESAIDEGKRRGLDAGRCVSRRRCEAMACINVKTRPDKKLRAYHSLTRWVHGVSGVTILLLLGSALAAEAPGDAYSSTSARARLLQAQLDHARAEQRRWKHLIDLEQDLTQHPDKFASAAADAAKDLKASGRDLVVEGVTGGLCSSLNLAGSSVRNDKELEHRFRFASATVKAAYTDILKDHLTSENAGDTKPSEETKKKIEMLEDTLGVLKVAIKDKKIESTFGASLDTHVAALQFLNAYLNDDEQGMQKYLPATKAMLEGTLDILKGLSAHRETTLEGYLREVAQQVPEFGPVAKNLAKLGTEEAALAINAANIGFGAGGIARGMELTAEAEEIRTSQMQAAKRLHALLPKARRELAAAEREERRLAAVFSALNHVMPPAQDPVLPSERFIDNSQGAPARDVQPLDIDAALNERPAIAHGFTPEALARFSQQFKEKSAADLARREAERRAIERARRIAQQEAEAARERQAEIRESRSSRGDRGWSSGGREINMGSHDLSHARAVVASIPSVRLP